MIAGLLAGAGLVLWSERFRRKDFAAFSYSLKAVGSGVLYLSLWAAFQLYGLIPAPMAMGLMILVTAWNAYMAWAQDAELLAAYALAGGFATPLLVSTGGNHEIFLFTYLLAIDLATVALVRLKSWPRLLFGAFPLTVAFFIAWYAEFYAASELATTAIFIALFGSAFASVAVRESAGRSLRRAALLEEVLLPLANAAFVALAFYSVLEDSGHHTLLPWMMVALAAAYLGLMRAPQTRTASAIHLSLAVVLLTIAVPLKASGHWITVSWLVEGLALLWVAARLEPRGGQADADESYATNTLRWLAMGSLILGYCGICVHTEGLADVIELPLLNWGTGTALIGIAVFAAVAWLALRTASTARAGLVQRHTLDWGRIAIVGFILIDLTAALLTLRELFFPWDWGDLHPPFQTADFADRADWAGGLRGRGWSFDSHCARAAGGGFLDGLRRAVDDCVQPDRRVDRRARDRGHLGALLCDHSRRGFAAGAGHLRLPDALWCGAAGGWVLEAQRVPALAGAAAAGLHHLQDLPLRHAQPERGISRDQPARAGRAADGGQLRVSEGLAQPAWGGGTERRRREVRCGIRG